MAGSIDEVMLAGVAEWLRAKTGLCFPESRRHDLRTALLNIPAGSGGSDPAGLTRRLEENPRLFDDLLAGITVAETYFFREPAQFDVLRREVLPELRRGQRGNADLRAWSAGCASGEEAYSLAILLEQEGLAAQSSVLGTDICRAHLARAVEARYGAWSLRGQPVAADWFKRQGDRFLLDDRFRRRVTFKRLNLAADDYLSAVPGLQEMDLILCRNVLIYFDQETVQRVAGRLFQSLRKGGWLVTGPSDPPLWDHAPFQTVTTAGGVFYRRGDSGNPEFEARHGGLARPAPASGPIAEPPPAPPTPAYTGVTPTGVTEPAVDLDRSAAALDERPVERSAYASRVRSLADRGRSDAAQSEAEIAIHAYPLCPELRYLHAIVLLERGRYPAAAESLRYAIYLDPSLAVVHFTLGSVLMRLSDKPEARRAFRNALSLALGRPGDEILPLSNVERAGTLAEAAQRSLEWLEAGVGRTS